MDDKGAWRDNVVVERLWRTIKYQEVCLRAYTNVPEARAAIGRYILFFNSRHPDGRGITEAEIHLRTPRRLFKQTEPALWGGSSLS
jgi:hypothetical protein